MKRFVLLVVFLAALLTACRQVPAQGGSAVTTVLATQVPPTATPMPHTLTIFAASSLTDASLRSAKTSRPPIPA